MIIWKTCWYQPSLPNLGTSFKQASKHLIKGSVFKDPMEYWNLNTVNRTTYLQDSARNFYHGFKNLMSPCRLWLDHRWWVVPPPPPLPACNYIGFGQVLELEVSVNSGWLMANTLIRDWVIFFFLSFIPSEELIHCYKLWKRVSS